MDELTPDVRKVDLGVGDGVFSSLAVGLDPDGLDPYSDLPLSLDLAPKDARGLVDAFLLVSEESEILDTLARDGEWVGSGGPWYLGVDHKIELLAKAAGTGAFQRLRYGNFETQGSLLRSEDNIDLVFSNCLYWASDPLRVLGEIQESMKEGGQLMLSLMLPNYFQHLLINDFPSNSSFASNLDRGRSQHYGTVADAQEWQDWIENAGFEIESVEFSASPNLVRANEWLDLREFYTFISHLARSTDPNTLSEVKAAWVDHLSHLASTAWQEGVLQADASSGTYLLVKARAN